MDWQWTREAVSRGVEAGWHRAFHLAVIRHGISWQISLGEAAPDAHGTEATCCPWLSAGKPLLALLAGRAVQAGFVDWDDPVAKWLPEFGGGGKHEVTIRHVLTHTGGFRLADQLDPAWDWDTALAWACAAPIEPGWMPGETAGYQARGSWLVLGEVLRRAWGGELEDLLQREVTGPLGLGSLSFSWNPARAARHGMGWARLRRTTRTAGTRATRWWNRRESTRAPGFGGPPGTWHACTRRCWIPLMDGSREDDGRRWSAGSGRA